MSLAALNLDLSECPEPAEKSPPASPADLGIFIFVGDLRARVASLLDEKWITSQKPDLENDILDWSERFPNFSQQQMVEKAEVENHISSLTESKSQECQRFYQQLIDELIFEFSLEDKMRERFQDLEIEEVFKLLRVEFHKLALKINNKKLDSGKIYQVSWQDIKSSFTIFTKQNPDILNQESNLGTAWFNFLASLPVDDSPLPQNLKFVLKNMLQNIVDPDRLLEDSETKNLNKTQRKLVLFLAVFLTQNQYNCFSQNQLLTYTYGDFSGKRLKNYLDANGISLQEFVDSHMPTRYCQIFHQNIGPNRPKVALTIVRTH